MDLHGFDLNLLIALDALLSEKSVTNAGRRVHLSQSAMSGVLARLRAAFKDELLVPSRGGMTLTPRAEELKTPVRAVLAQVQENILARVPFDPATARRGFTVAASSAIVGLLEGPMAGALAESLSWSHAGVAVRAEAGWPAGRYEIEGAGNDAGGTEPEAGGSDR